MKTFAKKSGQESAEEKQENEHKVEIDDWTVRIGNATFESRCEVAATYQPWVDGSLVFV